MLRRALTLAFTLAALSGCTRTLILNDLAPDSGVPDAAVTVADAAAKDDLAARGDGRLGPGSGDSGGACRFLGTVEFQPVDLWILLDRSSAMQASLDGSPPTSRGVAALAAIQNVLDKYQGAVNFGFDQFPASPADKASASCQTGTSCCAGELIAAAPRNETNLMPFLGCGTAPFSPCALSTADSPSYNALSRVQDFYAHSSYPTKPDSRYVYLITASEPSCAADSSDLCIQASNSASTLGAHMVVFAIGDKAIQSQCLNRIGGAGQTSTSHPATGMFVPISSVSVLNNQMESLVDGLAQNACTVDLYGISFQKNNQLLVQFDVPNSTMIQQLDPNNPGNSNGWAFANNGSSITFFGNYCKQIVSGTVLGIRVTSCSQWSPQQSP
jgi:hypothetical protein